MKKSNLCMVVTTPLRVMAAGKQGDIFLVQRNKKPSRILKIEKDLAKCTRNMTLAVSINNAAADIGLAPRIYNSSVCSNECRLYMEYIPSESMFDVMNKGRLTESILHVVFGELRKLYTVAPHGHGDLNFGNVLLSGQTSSLRVYFIDFTTYYGVYSKRDPVMDLWQMLYYANRTGLYKRYPFLIPNLLSEIKLHYKEYATVNTSLDLKMRYIHQWISSVLAVGWDLYDQLFFKQTALNTHLLQYIVFFNHHKAEVTRKFDKFYSTFITNEDIPLPESAYTALDAVVTNWTRFHFKRDPVLIRPENILIRPENIQ